MNTDTPADLAHPVPKAPKDCTGRVVAVYDDRSIVVEHPGGIDGRRTCPVHGPLMVMPR